MKNELPQEYYLEERCIDCGADCLHSNLNRGPAECEKCHAEMEEVKQTFNNTLNSMEGTLESLIQANHYQKAIEMKKVINTLDCAVSLLS